MPGNRGYKYFGAAKDLPGVRELFEQEPPPPPRKTRTELMKDIDADYYGYRDDDDGILVPLEDKAERIAIQKMVAQWRERQSKNDGSADETMKTAGDGDDDDEEDIYPKEVEESEFSTRKTPEDCDGMELLGPRFTAHVPVPTQKDIEAALLKQRKQELLLKYGI